MPTTTRLLQALACALGLTAAALALPQPLSAQIPTNGVIYACARLDRDKDEGKLVRLVAASEACKRNETRIQWNVTGAPGPQGPAGPAGANAPAGGISGRLTLCPDNHSSLAGSLVFVPGRNYNVWTGDEGTFQIDGMPQGLYTLAILRDGATVATVTDVPVGTTPYPLGDVPIESDCTPPLPPPSPECFSATPISAVPGSTVVGTTVTMPAAGGSFLIEIGSPCDVDVPWTATDNASWLSAAPGTGTGTGAVTVTVTSLSHVAPNRTGKVFVNGLFVTVNQLH